MTKQGIVFFKVLCKVSKYDIMLKCCVQHFKVVCKIK